MGKCIIDYHLRRWDSHNKTLRDTGSAVRKFTVFSSGASLGLLLEKTSASDWTWTESERARGRPNNAKRFLLLTRLFRIRAIWYWTIFNDATSRWQAIPHIAIDVTVPWSVCLSVCRALCSNGKKISTRFLSHTTAPCLCQIKLEFGNPFLPQFSPKLIHPLLIRASETFDGKLRLNG